MALLVILMSLGFIAPMIIMVIEPSLAKSLVTASVSIVACAFLAGILITDGSEAVSLTAAYAAVIIVFVGTNNV